MPDVDDKVLILRKGGPGLPAEELYDEIKKRVEDRQIWLARTPREEHELIKSAAVVTGYGLNESLLKSAQRLKWYAHIGIGTDSIPMELLRKKDVSITTASGLMPQIAEQVLGYLLYFSRQFNKAREQMQERKWRRFRPRSLKGSTVTIIGLGSIGQQLATRIEGFDVATLGIRYTPSKGGPTDEVFGYEDVAIHDALARTDYLVLACPLTEETRGLIGEEELETLPTSAVLANVARGEVVDTDALTKAIQNNTLGGAALDVIDPEPLPEEHPLWTYDNVLITPHTAGNSREYWATFAEYLAQNVEQADENGAYDGLENQVQ
jgi:phosphoglycerate dehydrogenase-like enzyme